MSCSPSQKNNSLMFSSRHYYLLHNILWLNIYNININIYMQWIKLFFIVWLILKAQLQRLLQTKFDLVDSFICFSFQFSTSLRDQWKQHGLWSTDHDWDWNLKYIDEKFLLVKKRKSFFRLFLTQYNNATIYRKFSTYGGLVPIAELPLKNNFFQNPDMEDDENPHLPHPLAVSPSSLPEEVEEVDFHRFHSTLVWQGLS